MAVHNCSGRVSRSVSFILVLLLVLAVPGCIAPRPSPTVIIPHTAMPLTVEEDVLTVAIDGNWPPFQFVNEAGEGAGFDVDLAIELANRLNLAIRIVPDTWSAAQAMVREGKADCIFSLTPTDDRSKVFDFSAPYLQVVVNIFVKEGSPIQSIEDLYGKKIAVEGGSTNMMRQVLGTHYEQLKVTATDSPEESLKALRDDEVDAAFIGAAEVGYYIARDFGLELRPVFEAVGVTETIGVKKGNSALLDQVNRVMSEIKADGTLDLIYAKWFGHE